MKKLVVLLLLLTHLLYSADINTTIVEGKKNIYQTLLKKLQQQTITNETNLQKTLLGKILSFSNPPLYNEEKIKSEATQQNYLHLFHLYIDKLFIKISTQQSIDADLNKLNSLSTQISSQENPLLTTQLFYTFYTKKHKEEEIRLVSIDKELQTLQSTLIQTIQQLSFNPKKILQQELQIQQQIQQFSKDIEQLKIKKERYKLLEKPKSILYLSNSIKFKQQQQNKLYRQQLDILFLDFSFKIQVDDKNLMKEHKKILSLLEKHIQNGKEISPSVSKLLTKIEQTLLGKVATFQAQGVQEIKTEVENLWKVLQQPLFTINKTPLSSFKLLLSLFIFVIGFFIGNFYKKYIKNIADSNKSINSGTHTLLANMGYYLIFIITFFIVLKVLGIDLSSIALVAGALSVGIGFGLQNIISNFVSGIILMVERSVKIGDYIELDNNLRGHVVDIKMRSITVNTNSNIDIIVPNQDLIQNRVINWTMNDKIRRFEIPFGVAYGTEPQKVISVILEAVQKSNYQDVYNTPERYTRIIMTGMGNSSVDFELFVWIKGKEILFPKRTISRFLVLIYNTLNEHNIEIPFPQQDLHIRSMDVTLPLK